MERTALDKEIIVFKDVARWLTEKVPRIAPGVTRYSNLLQIVRAFLTMGTVGEEGVLSLSYQAFTGYCTDQELTKMRTWTRANFIKECSNLNTWLLGPTCHRLGLPSIAIELKGQSRNGDNPMMEVVLRDLRRPCLKKLAACRPELSDEDWLRRAVGLLDTQRGGRLLTVTGDSSRGERHERDADSSVNRLRPQRGIGTADQTGQGARATEYVNPEDSRPAKVEPWEVTILHYHIKSRPSRAQEDMTRTELEFRQVFERIMAKYGGYRAGGYDVVFGYKGGSIAHAHAAVHAAREAVRFAERFSGTRGRVDCSVVVHTAWTTEDEGKLRLDHPKLHKAFEPAVRYQGQLDFPNRVLVTQSSFAHVQQAFECERIDTGDSAHATDQGAVHEIKAEKRRFEVRSSGQVGDIPLLGRQKELQVLLDAWERAKGGRPGVVWIHGMLGIGKSRLVDELLRKSRLPPRQILVCSCLDYLQGTPLCPLSEMLRDYLGLERCHEDRDRRARIRQLVGQLKVRDARTTDMLESLILTASVTSQDNTASALLTTSTDDATSSCERLASSLEPIIIQGATKRPVLLLIEDLHWADIYTRQLLHFFLERIREASLPCHLLVVVTCRPRNSIVARPDDDLHTSLRLNPLDHDASMTLMECLAERHQKTLDADEKARIVESAGGIPDVLWEETLGCAGRVSWFKKVMAESENRGERSIGIESRYVGQKAAILGEAFTVDELTAVIKGDMQFAHLSQHLPEHLGYLCGTGLIRLDGLPSQGKYRFAYGHIHDRFINSMSSMDRQSQHLITARALEKYFPVIRQQQPERLAEHYLQAGSVAADKAVEWSYRAAESDLRHSRNAAAAEWLRRALDLVRHASEKPSTPKITVRLLLALARAYAAMHGSSASEVQNAYNRAERLMRDVEDVLLDFRVRWGGWLMHFIHGELQAAQGVAQRLLRHPACTDHPICRLEAHHAMWDTLFHLGKMQTALAYHFDGMVMMASNPLKRMHYDYGRFTGNHDPHVCCLSRAALTLWLSGFLDQAIDTSNTAVARADEVDCINSRAHANAYAAITQLLARYPEKALQHANVALLIAKEDGLPQHLAMAEILSRLADAHLHPSESAIERAEDATARWQDLRIGILQTFWEGQIAEACLMAGSIRKGLQHIGHAVQALDRTHERFYGPELHRLKGELLLAESRKNRSEAKRQFYQAIELARECTMRLLALRSLLGLNKMLVDRDRGSEEERRIREDLVRAYDWYTQGPDTPDLLDTQAFLGTSVPCGSSTSSFGSVIPD